jgi:class 3 adenylate cyclase
LESVLNTIVDRKLCAILAADIVGFSDHMHRDEIGTIRALKECREIVDAVIKDFGGRIIFTAGDSVVSEFASAGDSVLCAQDMQLAIDVRNENPHSGPEMLFRIGLNVGDVVINDADLLGEGVNIAARLEALADPGGVFISGSVYDQISHDPSVTEKTKIESIGLKNLKNIAEPQRVYCLIKSDQTLPTSKNSIPRIYTRPEIGALLLETPDGPVMLVIGEELSIGRKNDARPIAIGLAHSQVSRIGKQSRIRFQSDMFTITDLDSLNGTFLNDELLAAYQPQKMAFDDGRCEISIGGGREPKKKGICRFIVEEIEAPDPALRISIDRDILAQLDLARVENVWTGLKEDIRRTWVFGTGKIFIGGDVVSGVSSSGATDQPAKVVAERDQGQYFFTPVGLGLVLLNREILNERTAVAHGDTLTLGEQDIYITELKPAAEP